MRVWCQAMNTNGRRGWVGEGLWVGGMLCICVFMCENQQSHMLTNFNSRITSRADQKHNAFSYHTAARIMHSSSISLEHMVGTQATYAHKHTSSLCVSASQHTIFGIRRWCVLVLVVQLHAHMREEREALVLLFGGVL